MRHCSHCHEAKPDAEFYRSKRSRSGFNGRCKACVSEYRPPRPIPAGKYHTVASQMAQEAGVPVAAIYDRCRIPRVWWARVRVWEVLRIEGYSLPAIAVVAGRDHTTIMCGLNTATDTVSPPPLTEFAVEALRRKYNFVANVERPAPLPRRAAPMSLNARFLSALAREARQ